MLVKDLMSDLEKGGDRIKEHLTKKPGEPKTSERFNNFLLDARMMGLSSRQHAEMVATEAMQRHTMRAAQMSASPFLMGRGPLI